MKKWLIIGAVIIGLLILFVSPYNGLVRSEEDVKRTWGDVETAYQRRSELIPNLVKTVQGAAEFEKSTLEAVISARAKATETKIDPSNRSEEHTSELQSRENLVCRLLLEK